MSQSDDFVSAFRAASQEAIDVLNKLQILSNQATLLNYPTNIASEAYQGTAQSASTISAGLTTFNAVLTALQANSNAGMIAIYNAAA